MISTSNPTAVETGVISNLQYDEWVSNWRKHEYTAGGAEEWQAVFQQNGKIQTGVTFDFDTLSYLFSSPGVVAVKMRFGLRKDVDAAGGQVFQLILFGVDDAQEVITPYFTSYAFQNEPAAPAQEAGRGNLPQALMKQWESNWHKRTAAHEVDQTAFKIRYGFLQGYNYPISEIMQALGAFEEAATIHIRFGLHRYYDMEYVPESQPAVLYTFGLILYASRVVGNHTSTTASSGIVEDSGYYDLTAPCPRTC